MDTQSLKHICLYDHIHTLHFLDTDQQCVGVLGHVECHSATDIYFLCVVPFLSLPRHSFIFYFISVF